MKLVPKKVDLVKDPWPFDPHSVGGIINVELLDADAFSTLCAFSCSRRMFTFSKLLQVAEVTIWKLPQEGELKAVLGFAFDLEFYEERLVGPSDCNAVVVKLLARRKQ